MKPEIKTLAEAITNGYTKNLIQSHVKELAFNEEAKHLVIYVDNAGPMHELSEEEGDHHLRSGLEKVYGEDITYEIKMHKPGMHEREKQIPHDINQ
jgi:hypothetical protein